MTLKNDSYLPNMVAQNFIGYDSGGDSTPMQVEAYVQGSDISASGAYTLTASSKQTINALVAALAAAVAGSAGAGIAASGSGAYAENEIAVDAQAYQDGDGTQSGPEVNVGSLAEEDSEQGLAHVLEHMAFNGSEHFAPGTLVEWFQQHGMAFGADTNASTEFSQTVYKLDLPTSDPGLVREGLTMLSDVMHGLLLQPAEVKAELGVIDGEERERDSAAFRAGIADLKDQFAGSRAASRIPIGVKEVRAAFTAEAERAFYEKWYRPENMTLVVVGDLGDLDPTDMVQELFGSVPAPQSAPVPAIQPDHERAVQMVECWRE